MRNQSKQNILLDTLVVCSRRLKPTVGVV